MSILTKIFGDPNKRVLVKIQPIVDKISGLEKFFDNIIEARVEVGKTANHHQKGNVFRAEVNLEVPEKHILRAEAEREDLYMAINEVKDELQIQIKKYKEKMRGNVRF